MKEIINKTISFSKGPTNIEQHGPWAYDKS